MKNFIMIALMVLFSAFSGNAQTSWEIDPPHSNVNFTIAHLVISDVTGKFNDFTCTVKNNGDDFSGAQVDVTIKTASIFTNNEKRDNHLRSADFFDAEKYPLITFKSTSFEKTGDDTYKISGVLDMHGVSKTVVLEAKYKGTIKDPWGNTRAGFNASTTLDRYDFGLKYNSILETGGVLIGQQVRIDINLELVKK